MPKKIRNEGGSQTDLRQANRTRVYTELSRRGALTQAEISRSTGLAASTVSNIVADMTALGLIERKSELAGPHGQLIGLVPTAGLALGIEIGHRHLTLALANLAHDLLATKRISLERHNSWADDLDQVETLLQELLKENQLDRKDLMVAGLAIPAPIDLSGRFITSTEVMPAWAGIDIAKTAGERLGLPVYVDNDANLGAVGERNWGSAKGVDDLVYLKIADGIGAGLVLGGQLYRGADGSAGEVGHTTIDEHGRMCRCGNRGCLETIASVPAILALMRPVLGEQVSIHDVIAGARADNTACKRVLADTGRVIGLALANLANTVNPRVIVVGGVLAEAGAILIDPIHDVLSRYAVRGVAQNLEFRCAEQGLRSHVLGAVSLALEHAPVG